MNGRAAKDARRVARLREAVLQAHDLLHKHDVDACHELLHKALGAQPVNTGDVAPLTAGAPFDEDFRALCLRHSAVAAYIRVDETPDGRRRLISGGHAGAAQLVDDAFAVLNAAQPS